MSEPQIEVGIVCNRGTLSCRKRQENVNIRHAFAASLKTRHIAANTVKTQERRSSFPATAGTLAVPSALSGLPRNQ